MQLSDRIVALVLDNVFYVLLHAMTTPGLFHCDLPITAQIYLTSVIQLLRTSPVGVAFRCCFQRKSVHAFSLARTIHLHHSNYILY